MGFDGRLEELSRQVRNQAVRRTFEEEGYKAEWGDEDHKRDSGWHFWQGNSDTLTLDRYLSGQPSPGAKGHQPDPNTKYVALQGTDVWEHVLAEFDWVHDAIVKFGQADPTAQKAMRDEMKDIALLLCADRAWSNVLEGSEQLDRDFSGGIPGAELTLENANAEFAHWEGEFATAFTLAFGDSMHAWNEIVQGNFYLAAALTDSIDAQTAVVVAVRKDVVNICEAAINALGGMEGGDEGVSNSTLLTIAGAVIATTLTVATGGAAAPAVVGAAFAITAAVVSEAEGSGNPEVAGTSEEEFDVSGDTVLSVLISATNHLATVTSTASEQEGEIKDTLWEAYNAVMDSRDKFEIDIAAKVPEPGGGAGQIGARDTTAETATLASVATTTFPEAAEPLLSANAGLAGIGDGDGVFVNDAYGSITQVQAPWTAVRDILMDVTATNGQTVKHTGEVLLDYAVDTGVIDDDNAQTVRDTYGDLDVNESDRDHEVYEPPVHHPGLVE